MGDLIFMDLNKKEKNENHTKSVAKKSQIQGSLFRTIERETDPSLASSKYDQQRWFAVSLTHILGDTNVSRTIHRRNPTYL